MYCYHHMDDLQWFLVLPPTIFLCAKIGNRGGETTAHLPSRNANIPVGTLSKICSYLLTLDGAVNVTNKEQSSTETNCPKHEKETIANAGHVPEEERGLHEA